MERLRTLAQLLVMPIKSAHPLLAMRATMSVFVSQSSGLQIVTGFSSSKEKRRLKPETREDGWCGLRESLEHGRRPAG